ncbi:MAG: hypothetical protein E7377_00315 [Clostridiales bacterium]|nr:hypothetical protein [Clostridiales bacterium]
MENQEVNKTILTEHRRVVGSRYFLALLNFLAILAGTVVTLLFVIKRGSPPIMQIYLYALIGINVAQIGICVADYILKTKVGSYVKQLTTASYIVAGVWLAMLIVELVTGTVLYGIFRIDLFLVTVIQILVALVAYLMWPHMNRRAIDSMIHAKARNNPDKRRGISKRFMAMYVFLSLFIIAAQMGSLLVYKVPPQLYDLFSESRAVKYELNEDGDGYVVAYVYTGTSPYVNIPATFNNKPVVGLKAGALIDDGLMEKYKVTEITFGTPAKNEAGEDIMVSNLQYIESGAIANNNIEKLTIPDTVVSIEKDAIVSTSLKTLEYTARAQFDAMYLSSCVGLETIIMSGENVGTIESLDGLNATTTIEVDKDIYNQYRKENFAYVTKFSPILDVDEFCLDFYTNFDYYIDSIFCKKGEEISLRYSDLKGAETQGVSPVVDTLAYIKDNHELGTQGAKEASAFRGWYFDPDFTTECVFTENGAVSIKDNATLYAKWITEYTGTLNWGTHQPEGSPSYVYWTDEDTVPFPVITDRAGYANGVEWRVSDTKEQVFNSQNFSRNITLDATWLLDKPTIDIVSNFVGNGLQQSYDKNIVNYTYDETYTLGLVADYAHPLHGLSYNGTSTNYSFYWSKVGDSSSTSTNSSINLTEVADTGKYKLEVTIYSPYGETASADTEIEVTIDKKAIDMGNVTLPDDHDSMFYSGVLQKRAYNGTLGSDNIKVTYTYYDAEGELLNINNGVMNAGEYSVVAKFEKNNQAEAVNYLTKTLEATFTIFPKELTYEGWAGNGTGWTDNSVVYNGESKQYKMQISGVLPNDNVELIYEQNSHTGLNAGTYESVLTGINNSNYTWSEMMRNHSRQVWTIEQKEVTVYAWQVDNGAWTDKSIVYDGKTHGIYAVMNGTVKDQKVNFVYSTDPTYVNSAVKAAKYSAKIIGVDDANYYFDVESEDAECAWEILRRELSVQFATQNLTYNGLDQGINVTIGNFVKEEFADFELSMFDLTGKSANVDVDVLAKNTVQSTITLSNKALNAGKYTAIIAGLNTSENAELLNNYTLSSTSQEFEIRQRELFIDNEFGSYTYNGLIQSVTVNVTNILPDDLSSFNFSQFKTGETDGAIVAASGSLAAEKYQLVFQGKDAGTYTVSVDEFVNGNNNYKLANVYTDTFRIAKKALTVDSWTLTDKTGAMDEANYTKGQSFSATYNYYGYTVTPVFSGVIDGETVELTLSGNEQTQAKSHTTTAVLDTVAYPNYTMTSAQASWEILPYTVDLSWKVEGLEQTMFVYDGETKTVTPVYTLLGDDTTVFTYVDAAQLIQKNKGDYSVEVKTIENSNYTLGVGTKFDWKIGAQVITLTWNGLNSLTYTGEYQGPGFSLSGFSAEDVDSGTLSLRANTHSNSYVYGTSANTQYFAIDAVNSYSFTGDHGFAVDAGTYKIDSFAVLKNGLVDKNYTIENEFSYEIAKKELTLSGVWSYSNNVSDSGEYLSSTKLIYNKSDYYVTTEIATGLVSRLGTADDIQLAYAKGGVSQVGTYTEEVEGLTGTFEKNYFLNPENSTFEWSIQPKVLVLDWTVEEKTYSGAEQTQNATINYVYNTDTVDDNDGKAYRGDVITLTYTQQHIATAQGNYVVKVAEQLDNPNYIFVEESSNLTCNWSISPKPVTLIWETTSFIYNKQVQYPKAWYVPVGGDKIEVTSYENYENVDAGPHEVTASALGDPNYTIDKTDNKHVKVYSIAKKVLELEWTVNGETDLDIVYDRQVKALVPAATNVFMGDVVNLTYGEHEFTDAGEYAVTVTDIDNGNYTIDGVGNLTQNINIQQAPITFVWKWDGDVEERAFTYDGNAHTLTATASGVVAGDTVNVSYLEGENSYTNVETYTVTVNGIDNDNYSFVKESKTLQINPQKVEITWTGIETLTYDGTAHTLEATVIGKDDRQPVLFAYDVAGNSFTNADKHTVTIDSLSDGNYTLDEAIGVLSKELLINPMIVTLGWSGLTNEYFAGRTYKAEATVTNACGTDVVTVNSYEANTTSKYGSIGENTNATTYAGIYKVKAAGLSNANYTLEGASDVEQTLTVAQQKVTVAWNDNSDVEYDGSAHSVSAVIKGIEDGVAIPASYSITRGIETVVSALNAGTYTFKITSLNDDNYVLDSSITEEQRKCSLTIKPRVVTLAWDEDTFTYDGNTHALAVIASNKVGNDAVGFTYTAQKLSANGNIEANSNSAITVGQYQINVKTVTNANYTLEGTSSNTAGTLTINPQKVTITWPTTTSWVYDGMVHSLIPTVTGSYRGVNMAVNFTYDGNGNTRTNEGSLTVKVASLSDPNYTLEGVTNASSILTIAPRPIELVWNAQTVEFDGDAHTVTASIKNRVMGDTVNLTYDHNVFTDADTYTVTITALDNTNYTLVNGKNLSTTFTIVPQKVKITWSDMNVVYDGNTHTPTISVVGDKDGLPVAYTLSDTNAYKNFGTYPMSVTLGNSNYTTDGVSNVAQSLVIQQKTVTLDWTWDGGAEQTFTYDGNAHTLTATVNGVVAGDTVNVSYVGGNSYTNVGTYTVTVNGIDNNNYTLSGVTSKTLNIAKKTVTLDWTWDGGTERTFTYDGNAHTLTATVNGVVAGDTVNVSYVDGNSYTDKGTYTVTASIDNSNYVIDGVTSKTLNIAAKTVTLDWTWDNGAEQTFTYDGNAHTLTATVNGVVAGDTVNVSYVGGNSYTNVGTYTVTIDGIDNSNYVIDGASELSQPLTIEKRMVTFDWTWDNGAERTFTYDGNAHTLKAIAKNVVVGDTVNVSYVDGNSYTNAGTHTVTIGGIDNGNYAFVAESKTLQIDAQVVSIEWANTQFVYDGNAHSATVIVTGSTGAVGYTLSANSFTNAGTYTVSVIALTNSNYTLDGASNTSTTLTITPRVLEFNWTVPNGATENGQTKSYTVTPKNKVSGDVVNVQAEIQKDGGTVTKIVSAGTYEITVTGISGTDAANYTIVGSATLESGTFTIAQAPVVAE